MVLNAARAAINQLFSAPCRPVVIKTFSLTILVLVGLWVALTQLFSIAAGTWIVPLIPDLPDWTGWFSLGAGIIASVGLALALAFLVAPVSAIVGSFYLDEIAEVIERQNYPNEQPGRALPFLISLILSLKFFVLVIVGNCLALLLLLVPGVNLVAFFLINGYLLGREYFEFAAMRYRSPADARRMRAQAAWPVFLGGMLVAAFLSIPLINLLTPFFASALMVHLHKVLSDRVPV